MLYTPICRGIPGNPSYLFFFIYIYFGEDHCRLSSDQSISKVPDNRQILILEIISKTFLFGLPDMYRARSKSLWVDRVVDTSRWRNHVSGTIEDLKQMRSWVGSISTAAVSLLTFFPEDPNTSHVRESSPVRVGQADYSVIVSLNVAMIAISPFSTLMKSSSLLCILGLAMGAALLREQKRLIGTTSTASVRIATPFYPMLQLISKLRQADSRSKNYGFQSTVIAHSLPQALFAWALLLLAIQAFLVTFADLPLPLSLTMFLAVAAVLVTARKAVYPHQKVFKDPALPTSIPL